jgi:hypothetical protein
MARGSLRAEPLCWPELVTCPQARFFLVAEIALGPDAENPPSALRNYGIQGRCLPEARCKGPGFLGWSRTTL